MCWLFKKRNPLWQYDSFNAITGKIQEVDHRFFFLPVTFAPICSWKTQTCICSWLEQALCERCLSLQGKGAGRNHAQNVLKTSGNHFRADCWNRFSVVAGNSTHLKELQVLRSKPRTLVTVCRVWYPQAKWKRNFSMKSGNYEKFGAYCWGDISSVRTTESAQFTDMGENIRNLIYQEDGAPVYFVTKWDCAWKNFLISGVGVHVYACGMLKTMSVFFCCLKTHTTEACVKQTMIL